MKRIDMINIMTISYEPSHDINVDSVMHRLESRGEIVARPVRVRARYRVF